MPAGDAAAQLTARTRADNTGLTRGMQEADRIVQQGAQQMQRTASTAGADLGGAMGRGLATALGVSLSIGGVIGLAKGAIELGQYGAQVDRLRTSFEGLAGADATPMLQRLRQASQGTVDDMNLMLSANKAMMLGVTQNADEMARLVEVAAVRGRAMGLSTQQAFNDIVTGIGRMSPMILDNLGILTGGQRGMEEYAKSIGKTAEALTDLEKRQYLVNKVLEGAQAPTEDAASGFEALDAQAKNLKASWAVGVGDIFGPAARAIADFTASALQSQEVLEPYTAALADLKQILPAAEYQALRGDVYDLSMAWDDGKLSLDEYKAGLDELIPGLGDASVAMQLAETVTLRKEQADMRAASAAWEHATAERELANAIVARGYAAAMDPWLVRRAQDPRAGAGVSVTEQIQKDEEALRKREQANEAAARKASGAASSAASKAQREAEQHAREYRSLIESVLQPTQVTGADVSATEHGAYQEKWDEEMRRLRAQKDVPYYQVAETERKFYSGQLLDQVNWDAVIADVARKQQEGAGRENLINEAMRRVEEAGIAANYADVAAALGIRDDTAIGMGAAEAFETGAKGIDVAAGITEQFIEQMKEQRVAYVEAGAEAMRAFLEGSDQAITPDAGKKFARRIVPFIYDEFQAQGLL